MAYIFSTASIVDIERTHVEEPDQLAVLQSRNSGQNPLIELPCPWLHGPWWCWCHCHCCQGYCNRIPVDNGRDHAAAAGFNSAAHINVYTHIEQL